MKKIIALLLALVMMVSMFACAKEEKEPATELENETVESGEGEASDQSVGETLLAAFKADHSGPALAVAERLIANKIIPFGGGASTVEAGFLSGFDNTEITGFEEGATFGPYIGSIAFVGYVFKLPEGADVEGFKTTLKEAANLRWNICVEAEEMIVHNEGNVVFFLMCPTTFEN